MSEIERVEKLQAARRQLGLAIRLLFGRADLVGVHTLFGAASVLLSDFVEQKYPDQSWDRLAQQANNLDPSTYFRITREAQNFFKHAKGDADSVLELDAKDTEALGFGAVMNMAALDTLSVSESVYQLWYLASHDPLLHDGGRPFSDALYLFGDLREVGLESRLEAGRRILDAETSNRT